jgi:hypothetical protein
MGDPIGGSSESLPSMPKLPTVKLLKQVKTASKWVLDDRSTARRVQPFGKLEGLLG